MIKPLSRRHFLSSAAMFLAAPACANAPAQSLRPVDRGSRPTAQPPRATKTAEQLVQSSGLTGRTAYAVADPASGQILEIKDEIGGLPPASVMKSITAAYALARLGPAHRFETHIIARGTLEGDTLKGDLILAGGGDPTLDTDALADMVRRLKETGLRHVSGGFFVWGGALPFITEIDRNQPDHVGYNPAICGLALNFNRVHFEWKKQGNQWATSMDARSDTLRPEVRIARMAIVSRSLPVYTYKDSSGIDSWTVSREALGQGGSRWLPVRAPDLYAGEVLRVLARAQGITLEKEQRATTAPSGPVLVRRASEPLTEILRDMLKHSTNLTAEMVGLAATKASGTAVTSIAASAAGMQAWAEQQLGMRNPKFVDHSGLGDASHITTSGMVSAMIAAERLGLTALLKDIPLRDERGKVNKAHPLQVIAKTGTLNFTSTLSGFATTAQGKRLVFAIFSIDAAARRKIKTEERENPPGAAAWNKKAKRLQQALLEHWAVAYSA